MMDYYDKHDGYEYYHHPIYGWGRIGKTPSFSLQLISLIFDILLLVFLFYCFYQTEEHWVFWTMLIAIIVSSIVGVVIDNKLTKKKKAEQKKLEQDKDATMMK